MKKTMKITGRILLLLLILIVLLLVIMTVYNQNMLRKNKALYETPLGQLVEVDGHNMSIFTSLKWDNEEDSHYTEYGYDLFSERGKKYSYLHITE